MLSSKPFLVCSRSFALSTKTAQFRMAKYQVESANWPDQAIAPKTLRQHTLSTSAIRRGENGSGFCTHRVRLLHCQQLTYLAHGGRYLFHGNTAETQDEAGTRFAQIGI
jgi:hypothetical protein